MRYCAIFLAGFTLAQSYLAQSATDGFEAAGDIVIGEKLIYSSTAAIKWLLVNTGILLIIAIVMHTRIITRLIGRVVTISDDLIIKVDVSTDYAIPSFGDFREDCTRSRA